MIFYNNLLAKCFLGKKKHYFMIGGLFFTRYKYLEVWEEMELRIHARQFWECFLLTLIPALGLSLWFSWWWMVLPFMTYHLLYWFEKAISSHSVFNWEALTYCGDAVYMRKRKTAESGSNCYHIIIQARLTEFLRFCFNRNHINLCKPCLNKFAREF